MKMEPTTLSSKMILLVDGYNAIHRIPEIEASLRRQGLENVRNKLALYLSAWGHPHPEFEIVIVFDGDPRFLGGQNLRLSGIRCLYSRTSHGGDDEIIRIVKDLKRKNCSITVVSDDNHVRNNCRAHGANVVHVSFIMNRPARQASPRQASAAARRRMNPRKIAAINNELIAKYGIK